MLTYGKQHQPYAVGNKIYGGGRSFPNLGPSDKMGYRERDLKHAARRAALLRRLKAKQKGNYMSPDIGRKI
jgi:hypothetical protein